MAAKALTQIGIAALRPGASRREVPDGKIGGLYLVVQPTGKMTWAYRYRVGRAPKKLTIGPYPEIEIGDARKLASKAAAAVASGEDPASHKQVTKAATKAKQAEVVQTVEKTVETFVSRYVRPNTKASSAREYERILAREVVAYWKGKPISSIKRADVFARIDAIVDGGAPVLANRFLAVVRKFFNWSIERGLVEANPCAGVRAPTAETSRDRILDDKELKRVWNASGHLGWPFGPMVRTLTLTGQRRGEVVAMRWEEVDHEAKTWTLPKKKAKNGVEHVVPLSQSVLDILETLPTAGVKTGFVFTMTTVTPLSGFAKAKDRLDLFVGEGDAALPPWVFHDLRRTAASGMARLGINLPVIEKVLNHVSGSFGGIVGVYQRHSFADEKRRALETWARHVESVVHDRASDVVELAEARA